MHRHLRDFSRRITEAMLPPHFRVPAIQVRRRGVKIGTESPRNKELPAGNRSAVQASITNGGGASSATQRTDKRTANGRVFLTNECARYCTNRPLTSYERVQDRKRSAGDRRGIDLQLRHDGGVSIAEGGVWQINLRKDQDEGEQKQLEDEQSPAPTCHGSARNRLPSYFISGGSVKTSNPVCLDQKDTSENIPLIIIAAQSGALRRKSLRSGISSDPPRVPETLRNIHPGVSYLTFGSGLSHSHALAAVI